MSGRRARLIISPARRKRKALGCDAILLCNTPRGDCRRTMVLFEAATGGAEYAQINQTDRLTSPRPHLVRR